VLNVNLFEWLLKILTTEGNLRNEAVKSIRATEVPVRYSALHHRRFHSDPLEQRFSNILAYHYHKKKHVGVPLRIENISK
jgi:hypothetical protein